MPKTDHDDCTWPEVGYHVLEELKTLRREVEHIKSGVQRLSEQLSGLKVKSGLWGLLGAAIPILLTIGGYLMMIHLR